MKKRALITSSARPASPRYDAAARRARVRLGRDIDRWFAPRRTPSGGRLALAVVVERGLTAAVLLRAQETLASRPGRRGVAMLAARLICRIAFHLTGAELLPGCVIGGGVVMRHPQGVVIGQGVAIGDDCDIAQCVTIGERYVDGRDVTHAYPLIGDRVRIGAGAVIIGPVHVGDDATIGANAVVVHDVPGGATAVGIPARVRTRDS